MKTKQNKTTLLTTLLPYADWKIVTTLSPVYFWRSCCPL